MKKIIKVAISAVLTFTTATSFAFVSPVSVSIVPPIQFPPSNFSVAGIRASALWGSHRDMYGFDFGVLGNNTEQDFVGIGVSGIFNSTHGTTTALGLQLAGIGNFNTNKASIYGVQAALGLNKNDGESTLVGLQVALANLSGHTTVWGVQTGLYNVAREVYGLQIGLVNSCGDLHGIQIGLANFHDKGMFVVSPIINVGW